MKIDIKLSASARGFAFLAPTRGFGPGPRWKLLPRPPFSPYPPLANPGSATELNTSNSDTLIL